MFPTTADTHELFFLTAADVTGDVTAVLGFAPFQATCGEVGVVAAGFGDSAVVVGETCTLVEAVAPVLTPVLLVEVATTDLVATGAAGGVLFDLGTERLISTSFSSIT